MRDWIERYGQHSWLAVLGNSIGFLSIFLVCDLPNMMSWLSIDSTSIMKSNLMEKAFKGQQDVWF